MIHFNNSADNLRPLHNSRYVGIKDKMAKLLEQRLRRDFPQLEILYPVDANALFVKLPSYALHPLQKKHFFWIWDEKASVARWMTSWDTQPDFIDTFCADLKLILAR